MESSLTPVATKLSVSNHSTRWIVEWPATKNPIRKTYYATTYPDSELVFIETAVTRRPVRGSRISAEVRAAIAAYGRT